MIVPITLLVIVALFSYYIVIVVRFYLEDYIKEGMAKFILDLIPFSLWITYTCDIFNRMKRNRS